MRHLDARESGVQPDQSIPSLRKRLFRGPRIVLSTVLLATGAAALVRPNHASGASNEAPAGMREKLSPQKNPSLFVDTGFFHGQSTVQNGPHAPHATQLIQSLRKHGDSDAYYFSATTAGTNSKTFEIAAAIKGKKWDVTQIKNGKVAFSADAIKTQGKTANLEPKSAKNNKKAAITAVEQNNTTQITLHVGGGNIVANTETPLGPRAAVTGVVKGNVAISIPEAATTTPKPIDTTTPTPQPVVTPTTPVVVTPPPSEQACYAEPLNLPQESFQQRITDALQGKITLSKDYRMVDSNGKPLPFGHWGDLQDPTKTGGDHLVGALLGATTVKDSTGVNHTVIGVKFEDIQCNSWVGLFNAQDLNPSNPTMFLFKMNDNSPQFSTSATPDGSYTSQQFAQKINQLADQKTAIFINLEISTFGLNPQTPEQKKAFDIFANQVPAAQTMDNFAYQTTLFKTLSQEKLPYGVNATDLSTIDPNKLPMFNSGYYWQGKK